MPKEKPPVARKPGIAPLGTPNHDEQIIDESIEETFPASDPPSASGPGSFLSAEDVVDQSRRREAARREEKSEGKKK